MTRRLLLRIARDLLLLPLSAFVVFQAVRLIPLPTLDLKRGDEQSLPAVVRMHEELGQGQGALAFLAPWRLLARGERLGTGSLRYDAHDLARALGGSLRIGGLALLFSLLIAAAFALGRAAFTKGAAAQALELSPTLIYGTPSFILALLVASFTGIASDENRAAFEPIAAAVISLSPGVFLGVLLGDALRAESAKAYLTAARARGRSRMGALIVHALPNALPALLDALPPVATALLAGSFVAEKLFKVTYFGYVYVQWALERQLSLVIVATTIFVALLLLVSLAAELLRLAVDPRLREAGEGR